MLVSPDISNADILTKPSRPHWNIRYAIYECHVYQLHSLVYIHLVAGCVHVNIQEVDRKRCHI